MEQNSLKIHTFPAHSSNYSPAPAKPRSIKYIVIHYTANNGDTARGNAIYFSRQQRGASAHYIVDENEAYKIVNVSAIAWHCGAHVYKHADCRNSNSIGIELCSRRTADGVYYFDPKTIENAAELTKMIMKACGIPKERVLRHYDVTAKCCPAPFVSAKYNTSTGTFLKTGTEESAWADFLARLS